MRLIFGVLTTASWLVYQLPVESFDFYKLADRYGVPVAFLIFITLIFLAQIKSERRERNTYREDMMAAMDKQVTMLNGLLAEARKANNLVCKYAPGQWMEKDNGEKQN